MFSIVLKDYIERLHDLSLIGDSIFSFAFIKATLSYILQSLSLTFWYVISFHWLRDFMDLPAIFKHNYMVIIEGQNIWKRSVEVGYDVGLGAYSFLDASPVNTKSLFSGFLNSFFLCLPLSVPHLLSARALIVNGIPAGVASALGLIAGQLLFFTCILFGLEVIIQPFLYCEPIIILFGCLFLMEILNDLGGRPDYTSFGLRDLKALKKLFWINFGLAWCEQICISNYFGNLNFTDSATFLETTNGHHFLFMTITYIFGMLIGNFIWSGLFGFLLLKLRTFISSFLTNISLFDINKYCHYSFVIGLFALAMSSFPYYGYDYFISNSAGYLSDDNAMEWLTPQQRCLRPISVEDRQADKDEDEGMDYDFVWDGKPFQSPDICVESNFEMIGIPSERGWRNRESILDRGVEKTGWGAMSQGMQLSRIPYEDDPKFAPISEPEYMITFKEFEDELMEGSIKQDTFEVVVDQAFRADVYLELNDLASETYIPETQVMKKFREKYYTNPVYKGLMKINNFSFLSGQPKNQRLSPKDEHTLYKRRVILQKYLNTISRYRRIIAKEGVAFPEKIYNQQFKGSLDFVRKFNAVRFSEYVSDEPRKFMYPWDEQRNRQVLPPKDVQKKVLKYDQPLYKKFKDESTVLLHEELPLKKRYQKPRPKRFLKLNDTRPLYIGWDASLKKFMIKSVRVASSFDDGQTVSLSNGEVDADPQDLTGGLTVPTDKQLLPESYHFQAWSPGVEKAGLGTKFKLPILFATKDELLKIQEAVELVDDMHTDDDSDAFATLSRQQRQAHIYKKTMIRKVFRNLPLYNWYWAEGEIEDMPEYVTAFEIGDATAPQLDGLGWPGRNERGMWQDPEEPE